MSAVPAAVTIRAQFYNALAIDTVFMGRLGNDVNRLQPRANADISTLARPFIVIAGPDRGSAPYAADLGTWELWLHDEPTKLTWNLDLLTSDLRRIFADRAWEMATTGPYTNTSRWVFATSPRLDKDYGTRFVMCRITTALAGM